MDQKVKEERVKSICNEFDYRVSTVGVTTARLELAKALAENEDSLAIKKEEVINLLKEAGGMIAELQDAYVSYDRATSLRRKIRRYIVKAGG